MLNSETVLNIHYEINHLDDILTWSASENLESIPVVRVYRRLLLLLRHPDEVERFEMALAAVSESGHLFPRGELQYLYTHLLNYCTRRVNRYNDTSFLTKYLEINQLLLKTGLIFDGRHLPPWRYTNLVAVGLKTGETDWTRQFIHEYREKLPKAYRENTFRYNLAQFYYALGRHDEAQHALLQVEFTDVLLNVASRSLLIKIYFETDQTELLFAYLEATRIFLLRNRLLDPHLKKQMQKFVEYTAKCARIPSGDRLRFQKLAEQLPPPQEMMHREWLAGQLSTRLATRPLR
jgi:tetratricopeptide (TPR) repeat protein